LFKPKNKFVKDFLNEQRLQLEFKAIKPPLPPKGGAFELHGVVLPADVSLWWLIEQLKFSEGETISILDHKHEKVGALVFEDLISVFYQYKKQQAHE
jgi:osmoprotectant transport system ATP-binding protein